MRFLLAGLFCLALGIGLTEYSRRKSSPQSESNASTKNDGENKKPTLPLAMVKLVETEPAGSDAPSTTDASLTALLRPSGPDSAPGFKAIAGGMFTARELKGGFGVALFVMDAPDKSALVRASTGEPPQLLLARSEPIDALAVDGSTVFFAAGGLIASTHARDANEVTVRARFKNAVVTSLSSAGDAVVATLMPRGADPLSTEAVGAIVSISNSGDVTLIAQEQVRPRGAQTNGKDAFWVAGFPPGLWKGALDGAYSSQLSDTAEEPISLDGDGVLFRAPLGTGTELRRVSRAGGKMQTLATTDIGFVVSSSGLVRYLTLGAEPKVMEVISGAEPTVLSAISGQPRGLALGGSTLFVLVASDDGHATLLAK